MPLRLVHVSTVAALGVALVRLAGAPLPADARRHAQPPGTGLPAIRFAQPPPDFTFDAGAGPRTLDSLFGGPVVINFWASWCEPCQAEAGAFATLRRTYGDGVPLVTVSEDTTPGAAEDFLRAHGVDAISVDDPERKIFALYTVVPIPVTLVLAPGGGVSHVSVGEIDWDELHAAVDAVRPGGLTLPAAFGTVSSNVGTP
jgi:cytochrome c biogenesis protein CcmG/thiol:disulfide interchange protein DsbE